VNKENKDVNLEQTDEEIDWDAFFTEEKDEEWEQEKK
jgi:hypothetical protein